MTIDETEASTDPRGASRRELLRMSAIGGAAAAGLLGFSSAASWAHAPAASSDGSQMPAGTGAAVPNPAKGVVLFKDPAINF